MASHPPRSLPSGEDGLLTLLLPLINTKNSKNHNKICWWCFPPIIVVFFFFFCVPLFCTGPNPLHMFNYNGIFARTRTLKTNITKQQKYFGWCSAFCIALYRFHACTRHLKFICLGVHEFMYMYYAWHSAPFVGRNITKTIRQKTQLI